MICQKVGYIIYPDIPPNIVSQTGQNLNWCLPKFLNYQGHCLWTYVFVKSCTKPGKRMGTFHGNFVTHQKPAFWVWHPMFLLENHRNICFFFRSMLIVQHVHWGKYLGCCPLPVTVTTRIITFLIGNPYKPSFTTVTVRGPHPRNIWVI